LIRLELFQIDSIYIGDPAAASRGDSGDAVGDAVAIAEFLRAVCEQADERSVDVAEAEEAEVVGADGIPQGLKPDRFVTAEPGAEAPLLDGCAGDHYCSTAAR
jgi:hypothetical protein